MHLHETSARICRATPLTRLAQLGAALAVVVAMLSFAAADASALSNVQLKFARCYRASRPCHGVRPRGRVLVGGAGFQQNMLVVFTVRQGGYLMNATSTTRVLSARRVAAHVPANAVSGPIYVLGTGAGGTGVRSNSVELNVRNRPGACPSRPGPGGAVARWAPTVVCVLGLLHQPQTSTLVNDVFIVISHESSGDPSAINNWDVNAQNGDPTRGLMQVTGSNFSTYRDPALPDNIYDPAANIYTGLAYGIARYGSIPAIPGVASVSGGGPYVPYKTAASH